MKSKGKSEYARFDEAMRQLLSVSHGEIKAKLDAEKRGRAKRKAKRSKRH